MSAGEMRGTPRGDEGLSRTLDVGAKRKETVMGGKGPAPGGKSGLSGAIFGPKWPLASDFAALVAPP